MFFLFISENPAVEEVEDRSRVIGKWTIVNIKIIATKECVFVCLLVCLSVCLCALNDILNMNTKQSERGLKIQN